MISVAKADFWKCYNALDPRLQRLAAEAYEIFKDNSGHPSLRFKKLAGHDNLWSVRVDRDVRAVGVRRGDTIEWFWIGHHDEFDQMFS